MRGEENGNCQHDHWNIFCIRSLCFVNSFAKCLKLCRITPWLLGAILGIAALVSGRGSKGIAIAGIALNGLAILVGVVRFVISLVTTGGIV